MQWGYFIETQLIKTTSSANPGLAWVQICNQRGACEELDLEG